MIKVVLIELGPRSTCTLSAALSDAGYEVVRLAWEDADLVHSLNQLHPAAVLVAASSAGRGMIEQLAAVQSELFEPLFLILSEPDQKLQAIATRVGLSAYVAESISPALVRTLVEVSVQRYQREHSLLEELAQVQEKLDHRTVIDRARCLIMETRGFSEKQAFQTLRTAAMQKGLQLPELARQIMLEASEA
ncbi:MAG: ANTAR domain-containing response regulator [Oceanococcus sp.]